MSPNEVQTLARAVGRVEGKLDSLAEQVGRVVAGFEGKASNESVDALRADVNELKQERTRVNARDGALKGAFGAVVTLLGLFIANGGHI